MRKLILIVTAITVAGCATPEQVAQRQKETDEAYAQLEKSQGGREYTCSDKASCDKAWKLAKVYVQERADMKVQISDDTMISTYRPMSDYRVGLRATSTPGKGDSATIRISAECKDNKYGRQDICPAKVALVYMGFKPYIQGKMD